MTNPPSDYGSRASTPDEQTHRRMPESAVPPAHAAQDAAGQQGAAQHGASAASTAATAGSAVPRRILGIQPALFVGMCLLAIVTVITVVLIFIGDFESQAPRVVWTVVVFLAFTGLLALDLVFARRSSTPLVIGVIANTYLLAVLMIAIWVRGVPFAEGMDDPDVFSTGWLFAELFGIVLLTLLVVRAAAAGAWGLINLGKASGTGFGRWLGVAAAGLVGLAGVLLTLHYAIDAFGIEVNEWYWRTTVAAIVVAALASSVTVLLFWNRRNLDWQEADARGEHARPAQQHAGAQPGGAASVGGTARPGGAWQGTVWTGEAQPTGAQPYPGRPVAGPSANAAAATAAANGAATAWPAPQPAAPQPAAAQAASGAGAGAGAEGGLLPWPTYADGTPYPMGPDGQPVFPPGQR